MQHAVMHSAPMRAAGPAGACSRRSASSASQRIAAFSHPGSTPARHASGAGARPAQRLKTRLHAQSPVQRPAMPPQPPTPAVDPALFNKVLEAESSGETLDVKVKMFNKGGAIVNFGELRGFIPYNQLANRNGSSNVSDMAYLIGQTLKAKVVSVDKERKDFVLSEKKAQQSEAMKNIHVGKTLKSVVTSVEDYGAFVELVDYPGVTGLVHKSELSWDSFVSVDSVVKKGQVVRVKVIDLDVSRCRLGLSMKQCQPDPIRTTLDTVQWGPSKSIPTEIQVLMDKLKAQQGVQDVYIGRQANESKIASQELVVYLCKDNANASMDAADGEGYDMVARLGSVMQELHIVTDMTRQQVKVAMNRAMSS